MATRCRLLSRGGAPRRGAVRERGVVLWRRGAGDLGTGKPGGGGGGGVRVGLKDRSGQVYTYEKGSWVQERDVQGGFSEGCRCVKGCHDSIAILWLCLLLYLVQKSVHSQEAEEAQETLRR